MREQVYLLWSSEKNAGDASLQVRLESHETAFPVELGHEGMGVGGLLSGFLRTLRPHGPHLCLRHNRVNNHRQNEPHFRSSLTLKLTITSLY